MRLQSVGFETKRFVRPLLTLLASAGMVAALQAATISEVAAGNTEPVAITTGPDGNLWITQFQGNSIAKMTPTGVTTTYAVPTLKAGPNGITVGGDGNLWFAERTANKIGRITPAGVFKEFPVKTAGAMPTKIAAGADGNLWFTENGSTKIGRITPAGVVTEFSIPSGSTPYGIAAGPNGDLWFTETKGTSYSIGVCTTSGTFNEVPLPFAKGSPLNITEGPDDRMWFVEAGSRYGRIDMQGDVVEYGLVGNSVAKDIVAASDDTLWLTELDGNRLVNISVLGDVLREYSVPTAGNLPCGVTQGPNKDIYFTELGAYNASTGTYSGSKIGELIPTWIAKFSAKGDDGIGRVLWSNPDERIYVTTVTPAGVIVKGPTYTVTDYFPTSFSIASDRSMMVVLKHYRTDSALIYFLDSSGNKTASVSIPTQ